MCGIFGVLQRASKFDNKISKILADRMTHRGPDGQGLKTGASWFIGMRRLSIIDLVGGQQPISNEDGTIHLVFNGEIYNYRELRANLINKGHKFKTESDVEVLIHLYEDMGREAIHHLNGMFAFAVYDSKRQSLWVARDRLGIKPLFYSYQDGDFLFSSELSGLAEVLKASFSKSALIDYLGYSYVPAPKTPYEGILKLNPGEEIEVSATGFVCNKYWQPKITSKFRGSSQDAAQRLDVLLKDAIKMQLVSDVPLGLMLSGGVDSSAIASYAAELSGGNPLNTFTIDFENKNGSDAKFATLMSDKLNTVHTSVRIGAEDQFRALGELINLMDEPMSDSAIVPTYLISKAAQEKGIKVLLSGAGGDEIFGGYPRHFPGKVGTAAWFASRPKVFRTLASKIFGLKNPSLSIRLQHPSRNFLANISGVNLHFLKMALKEISQFNRLINDVEQNFSDAESKKTYPLMMLDLKNYLPNNVLSLTDKATMAASIEGRVPLLDHRIVEFAYSLPEKINLLRSHQKGLFKQTLVGRVPKRLLYREKEGFNAPIHNWVERWPDRLRDSLLGDFSGVLSEIIHRDTVEKWLEETHLRRKAGNSLYALYVLNLWLNSRSRLTK